MSIILCDRWCAIKLFLLSIDVVIVVEHILWVTMFVFIVFAIYHCYFILHDSSSFECFFVCFYMHSVTMVCYSLFLCID